MIKYQFKKQRHYEIIKTFIDESSLIFTCFERLVDYTKKGIQESQDGVVLQKLVMDRCYNLRALAFFIKDSSYVANKNKKIVEDIYSNFAAIVNNQGDITPYMEAIRTLLGKLTY
jgi:hypothetical protein